MQVRNSLLSTLAMVTTLTAIATPSAAPGPVTLRVMFTGYDVDSVIANGSTIG